MRRISIKSYGKINLSLDVLRRLENGYHEVDMIMQQILLHDDVLIRWIESQKPRSREAIEIELSTNKHYLPTDHRNLAYKAAMLMCENFGAGKSGKIRIDIKKRIPVAAGLAGGSGNGAAVLHGLNKLWNLKLSLKELTKIGTQLGSDVPFSLMGQAKVNGVLRMTKDPLACHCARAVGTGTQLIPIKGLQRYLILSKPPMGVSTAEVYQGLKLSKVQEHPNTEELIGALETNNSKLIKRNMINVLENFTLKRYASVMYTKNKIQQMVGGQPVLMSGSGPTIFGFCGSKEEAQRICRKLEIKNKESYWTRTTF